MADLRVLHITDNVRMGGTQNHLYHLPQEITNVLHCCVILYGSPSDVLYKEYCNAFDQVVIVARRKYAFLFPLTWVKFYKAVRATAPDVIHAHVFFSVFFISCLKCLKMVNVPIIATLYNLRSQAIAGEYLVYSLFQKYITFFAAPVESNVKELIQSGIDINRIRRIYLTFNILDPPQSECEDIRAVYGIDTKSTLLVRVARFDKDKGYFELIDILARMKKKNIDFHALLLGDGPDMKTIRRMAVRRKLSDKVTFCGVKKNYIDYILSSDIALCTSIREGFGVANMAALKMGKPFVCFAVGGLADLRDKEYLHAVPVKAIDAFTASLETLIVSAEERRVACKFLKEYYEKYLGHNGIAEYRNIYFDSLYRTRGAEKSVPNSDHRNT